MVLIKANSALNALFQKVIRITGEDIEWTNIFAGVGNDLILVGEGKSLCFNFTSRSIYVSKAEIPVDRKAVVYAYDELLENVLNMTLYAFGKWGQLKGLKSEKGYDELNILFDRILGLADTESDFSRESLRFFSNGMQITYEDVLKIITDKEEPESKKGADESNEATGKANGTVTDNIDDDQSGGSYRIGLWHRMKWESEKCTFEKEEVNFADRKRPRIGNGFYVTGYKCPVCSEKLYMVLFPHGNEFRIETDIRPVYLARAYACSECSSFYTPKPRKLLMEGDVFQLKFADDRIAFEDYIELLGRKSEKTSNSNFNMYESEYLKLKNEEENKEENKEDNKESEDTGIGKRSGSRTERRTGRPNSANATENNDIPGIEDIPGMTDEYLYEISEKMEAGFYPSKITKKFQSKINREIKKRREKSTKDKKTKDKSTKDEPTKDKSESKHKDLKSESVKVLDTVEIHEEQASPNMSRSTELRTEQERLERLEAELIKQKKPDQKKPDQKKPDQKKPEQTKSEQIQQIQKQQKKTQPEQTTQQEDNSKAQTRQNQNSESQMQQEQKMQQEQQRTQKQDMDLKAAVDLFFEGGSDLFDSRIKDMSKTQLQTMKQIVLEAGDMELADRKKCLDRIDKVIYKEKEKEMVMKASEVRGKNFSGMLKILEEIEKEDVPEIVRGPIVKSLTEMVKKAGEKELDNIVEHIPERVTAKQYNQISKIMDGYWRIVDTDSRRKKLDQKRAVVETQEIKAFIVKSNAKDRKSLLEVYKKLQEQDYNKNTVEPFLEKIHDRIYEIDEAAIKKICADPATLDFEQGIRAYSMIEAGDFLPELKADVLAIIDKRLIRLKSDECEQLTKKLSKDFNSSVLANSRVHICDIRAMKRGNAEQTDSPEMIKVNNALNTYASGRGKYEFPLLVCDGSHFRNMDQGFVLTEDHIFYKGMFDSEVIDVSDIDDVYCKKRPLRRGFYVYSKRFGEIKIANSLGFLDMKPFLEPLKNFVFYLKEKPESRNVEYLAVEKHSVKCCLRCGFIYKDAQICPRCGSKSNR